MPERDANQLAADVRAGLAWMANYNLTATEQTLHIDFQGKARELLPALDELVGLVGTLQQRIEGLLARLEVEQADHKIWAEAEEQRDAYRVLSEAQASEASKWRKRADAAESLVGTLQQERDAFESYAKTFRDRYEAAIKTDVRLEEFQRDYAEQLEAKDAELEAAEAALATTRQALKRIAQDSENPNTALGHVGYIARRALADTGGDTKEPA